MKFRSVLSMAAVLVTLATTSMAVPINLNFEARDDNDNVILFGTFYGLDNEDASASATSFDLFNDPFSTGNPSFYEDVALPPVAQVNTFTFDNGALQTALVSYQSLVPRPNSLPPFFPATLQSLSICFGSPGGLRCPGEDFANAGEFTSINNNGAPQASGSTVSFTQVIAPVPLPAGGLLLLSALGGAVALRRRKKRAS